MTHTEQKLEAITDEGLFEKLATAVLREADPTYRVLIHSGVNSKGKTIKSPVDGIGFVPGVRPSHMVIVHHTTTAQSGLISKWLHDPTKVKPRGNRPTAPEGDVLKAMAIAAEQRIAEPGAAVTLVLTTNHEPDEETIRQTHALAASAKIDVDFWGRSRLAHFLDTDAQGQWLRKLYLGDEPERLSFALLQNLAHRSLTEFSTLDSPELWVHRALDETLANCTRLGANFLVAQSGLGKSTACYKLLKKHIASGGVGMVLPESAIAGAITLDGAIQATLNELHPGLAPGSGSDAIALCTANNPLLLIVDDINLSGQATTLTQKLLTWDRRSRSREGEQDSALRPYLLVCPVWPEVLSGLHDHSRSGLSDRAVFAGAFSHEEGKQAVLLRSKTAGASVSDMDAEGIAAALGYDPLLIALHDPRQKIASATVIGDFIENQIIRIAHIRNAYPAAKYRLTLRAFAGAALCRRNLDPEWGELETWSELSDNDRELLGQITQSGEIVRLIGSSTKQRISYRHDRVRDWVMIDTTADLLQHSRLPKEILSDPYFAEIVGGALANITLTDSIIASVLHSNPLALFASLRFLPSNSPSYPLIVRAIDKWLDDPDLMSASLMHLRWEAVSILGDTEAPDVVRFVRRMQDGSWASMRARLRNGDLMGGVELCYRIEPGSTALWRDIQLGHAKQRFGSSLIQKLSDVLQQTSLTMETRVGLLRMAGHMADARLAPAIEASWNNDATREAYLGDYLWAFGQSCGDDPDRFLKPVCDAWAALSSEETENHMSSPRDDLAANQVRWAFRHWVPRRAIPYFIKRAEQDDLRWPIIYMLSEIDDPLSIEFVVEELAATSRRLEGTGSFSPFSASLPQSWRRLQDEGKAMSLETRSVLLMLWLNPNSEKYIQRQAFRLWAATHGETDLEILRRQDLPSNLADQILHQRLERGDKAAIPALLELISEANDKRGWWWHSVKHVWSDELLPVLDSELSRRAGVIEAKWQNGNDTDYQTADLLMGLQPTIAEKLLIKYWPSLHYVSNFVQTAISIGTPALQDAVRETMNICSEPLLLLKFLGQHIGLHTKDHPGITRHTQIQALEPYLAYLQRYTIVELWELCNERGWFDLRQAVLDPHMRLNGGVPFESEEAIFSTLDDMVKRKQIHFLQDWLRRYQKTGASDEGILACIARWLNVRQTIDALKLTSEALTQIGRRSDLSLLDTPLSIPNSVLAPIKANATFAVQRRTLL